VILGHAENEVFGHFKRFGVALAQGAQH